MSNNRIKCLQHKQLCRFTEDPDRAYHITNGALCSSKRFDIIIERNGVLLDAAVEQHIIWEMTNGGS